MMTSDGTTDLVYPRFEAAVSGKSLSKAEICLAPKGAWQQQIVLPFIVMKDDDRSVVMKHSNHACTTFDRWYFMAFKVAE